MHKYQETLQRSECESKKVQEFGHHRVMGALHFPGLKYGNIFRVKEHEESLQMRIPWFVTLTNKTSVLQSRKTAIQWGGILRERDAVTICSDFGAPKNKV